MRRVTQQQLRRAIDGVRQWHARPPQNGSQSDAYNLLADVAEQVLELADYGEPALEGLRPLPDKCPTCGWTPGTCMTCVCYGA